MVSIELTTKIHAPVERVFDLARSIDAHKASASKYKEEAIHGKTSGLIGLDEEVTWTGIYFGIKQYMTVRITAFERPTMFIDEMVKGLFKWMKHTHRFESVDDGTLMYDQFTFEAPFGFIGRVVERWLLEPLFQEFLTERNEILKQLAESDDWQHYLPSPTDIPVSCDRDDRHLS